MGVVKQIDIKNRTYYFYNDSINNKNFESKYVKIWQKILVLTTLNFILIIWYITIKKLMIVKIFTVWILCIYLLIMQMDILRKKVWINI